MEDEKRNSVVQQIERAFRGVGYPGDEALLHPRCLDDADIKRFYGRKQWQNIPASIICKSDATLAFLSPEAYRFFLPAFLAWTLRNYDLSDSIVIDTTVYSLAPCGGELREFMTSKYSLFDAAQRCTVLDFLEFLRDNAGGNVDQDAVREAIGYWAT